MIALSLFTLHQPSTFQQNGDFSNPSNPSQHALSKQHTHNHRSLIPQPHPPPSSKPRRMSATSPAPADEEPTPRPEANAELEPAKAEIPPSSTLSSLSELESPFTPARLRRKVTSTQPVIESPSKSEAKSIPRRPKRKTPAKKKAPKKLKWDAESIIKDPKSPLATANLRVGTFFGCFSVASTQLPLLGC